MRLYLTLVPLYRDYPPRLVGPRLPTAPSVAAAAVVALLDRRLCAWVLFSLRLAGAPPVAATRAVRPWLITYLFWLSPPSPGRLGGLFLVSAVP